MSLKSAVLLLSDITAIKSYTPLVERAARELLEDATLDILIIPILAHLNLLDAVLSEIYTLTSDILQQVGKPRIDVKVLFNDHYKELRDTTWQALIIDASDENFNLFEFADKDILTTFSTQRSAIEHKSSAKKLDPDGSFESIHRVSAVGGTFDHFHNGHKILLSASAFLTKTTLIVGVTDEELLKNKQYAEFLQTYDYRVHVAREFLNHIKPSLSLDPVPIRDVCGPTAVIEDIDGLIVSKETVKGADFINKTRAENGMHELTVHIINVINSDDEDDKDGFKNKLSSTQLRKEEYELFQLSKKS